MAVLAAVRSRASGRGGSRGGGPDVLRLSAGALALSALLMAGIDGIQNKIHPGDAADKDLYDLPPEEGKAIPTVASSLDMALAALDADRAFLTTGGVFSDDMIDAYIALKAGEIERLNMTTHPVEFDMYYSV